MPRQNPPTKGDKKQPQDNEEARRLLLDAMARDAAASDAKIDAMIAAAREREEALDRQTGGQYGALRALRNAIVKLLKTEDGELSFKSSNPAGGDEAAKALELAVLGRERTVAKARRQLLASGYDMPAKWRKGRTPATVEIEQTAFGTSGTWAFWVTGPSNRADLATICGEMTDAIDAMEVAWENQWAAKASRKSKPRHRPPTYDPVADRAMINIWDKERGDETQEEFEKSHGWARGALRQAKDRDRKRSQTAEDAEH